MANKPKNTDNKKDASEKKNAGKKPAKEFNKHRDDPKGRLEYFLIQRGITPDDPKKKTPKPPKNPPKKPDAP
jgi:hypothetical protein